MRRRDVLAGAALAATFRSAHAQQPKRVYRLGYLGINPTTTPIQAEVWKAFDEGLRAHGLIEGENVIIRRLFSEGREERQPGFVADLIEWRVDVIVCGSSAGAQAASAATKTIPIILAAVGDPDRMGIVQSLARPGGNVTGVSNLTYQAVSRQYQLLKEVVPNLTRIAVLWNPNSAASAFTWEVSEREAPLLGLKAVSALIAGPEDVAAALRMIEAERAEALEVHNTVMAHRASILSFALEKKLPVLVSTRSFLDPGVLISYGPNLPEGFRRAAAYIDKVLKGANPGDLPIEQPSKFELAINLRTVRAIGVDIPVAVLALADEVLE
jgi:putative ABC transport system substrate-binding protein